jgi:hypothetical protein
MLLLLVAVTASALTSAWWYLLHHLERRSVGRETCGHEYIYHSLYREGNYWNRICWRCQKHETHWPTGWPPEGSRLRRGEKPWRPKPKDG